MASANKAAQLVTGIDYTKGGQQRQTSSSLTKGATMDNGAMGDWNDEVGSYQGGATFVMADVGAMGPEDSGNPGVHSSYFQADVKIWTPKDGITNALQYKLTYSPNRQMFSPMQMGSLMTGVASAKPWQTLLFCPNSAATIGDSTHPAQMHPGAANPPDHLFADLFWMPIVDPYPISETFSTAGKINLNYGIEPFTHIQRATGLYALMKSTNITAISDIYASPGWPY
jgi:hypothetical protein